MKVVLGLGNPGRKYSRSRHNLGFLVVDRIAAEERVAIKQKSCRSLIGQWLFKDEKVLLVKPQTYMNQSGKAVEELCRAYSLGLEDLAVIHDDLDLPFGRIRVRPRGGAGGHRGVSSILESLGGKDFYRIRVGIGRPPEGTDPTDFVLQPFSPEEIVELDEMVGKAAGAVRCLLEEGAHRAMQEFNRADQL